MTHSHLIKALRRLLHPLMRLLLERGLTYPLLAEALKGIYVEVAKQELERNGRSTTMSAISLASGIHRKDVKRLVQATMEDEQTPRAATLGARLLGVWLGDPRYLGDDGAPLALPRSHSDAQRPSFETLVASVNRDVRPRSVLEDWLRLGLVELTEDDQVVLLEEAFVPSRADEELLHYFGRNLRDHIAAGCHNLTRPDATPLLERALFYDGLTPESLAELREVSREQGMALLRSLNREALARAEHDEGDSRATGRMTLGVYYFEETVAAGDDDAQ